MGYCPLDRIDYNEEVEECVVCGGPLIEESIEDLFEEIDPREWVDLDPLSDPLSADPAELRDRIRDAGIVGLGGAAFPTHVKLSPPKDKPIVCAAAQVVLEQGRCRDVRLALGGVAERPVCMPRAMQRLRGSELATSSLDEAAAQAASSLSPRGDFRGSGEYRQEMAAVLARRALSQAASHAKGKQ